MRLAKKLIFLQVIVSIIIMVIGSVALQFVMVAFFSDQDRLQISNLSNQIMLNVDQKFEELKRFSNVIINDQTLYDYVGDYIEESSVSNQARISLYLSNAIQRDGLSSYQVHGILMTVGDKNQTSFTTVGLSDNTIEHLTSNVIPAFIDENLQESIVSPFEYSQDSGTQFGNDFSWMYGYICKFENNGIPITLVIISPYDEIIYNVKNTNDFCDDYLILDGNKTSVEPSITNSKIDINYVLDNIAYGSSYREGYVNERGGFTTVSISSLGNWMLMCRLTNNDIIQRNLAFFYFDIVSIVIFDLATIFIMVILINNMMTPLQNVSNKMRELANGDLSVRIDRITNDEVGEVAVSFNSMADQLNLNIKRMIEKEVVEQKLRYKILISQVNPHFIYNTMNTITYLAQQERSDDIIAVNKALIDILRDRLTVQLTDIYDTVEQEISVIKKYLVIQNYRFSGAFKTDISIPENAKKCYIVKGVLQPLVENSLLHGILNNKDEDGEMLGGCIRISAEILDESKIRLEVSDNGIGMTADMLDKLNKDSEEDVGQHIGIWNIKERLKYIYQNKALMTIWSKEEEGTKITLILPCIYSKE